MSSLVVNGTSLEYVELGKGDPVVFVHGSLEDYRSWTLQMEPFAERYHVVAYSRRYHYPNAWAGDGHDYAASSHGEDLAGLLSGLSLGPAHLVCSSYGGYAALCMARQRLDLVRSLVLGEPPLMPWLLGTPEGIPLAETFMSQAFAPARAAFAEGDLEAGVRLFLNGVIGREAYNYLPAPNRQMVLDNGPAMAAETLAPGYFSPFSCADAGRIDRAALLLDGERSPALFYRILDELAQCLPRAERAIIPGTSHAMHLGNARVYNETVLAFLARH